jgi:hypothetical protein
MELSPPVRAATQEAVRLVETVLDDLLQDNRQEGTS